MAKSLGIAVPITAALYLICGVAFAQTISIIAGNGQLLCENCGTKPISASDPLVVQVRNAAGRPLPNATVSWTYTNVQSSVGRVSAPTTVTDANGLAANNFILTPALGSLVGIAYVQGAITAKLSALPPGVPGTTGQSVVFTESNAVTAVNGFVEVQDSLLSPAPGSVLSGPAGSTSTTPIQVRVEGLVGGSVPGVAVLVRRPFDPTEPSLTCAAPPGGQPNTALTDAAGIASCYPVFGSGTGAGSAQVVVGQTSTPFDTHMVNFRTLRGVSGSIQISSGNNQSGNAGNNLPASLVAVVEDQGGNPLSGVSVTWRVISGSATLFNTRTSSDANGRVNTNVTLGNIPGKVLISVAVVSAPVVAAIFTETVNLVATQLRIISGNNQTTEVSTAFPSPLVVQLSNATQPVAGVTIAFAVKSGSATIGSATAITNAAGQAQITVTAGFSLGKVVITATIGTFSTTFNLTIIPPGPVLTAGSFSNAATGVAGAISPCSLATITAQGLAPGLGGTIAAPIVGPLPLLVNNATVAFQQPPAISNTYAPIVNIMNVNGREQMTVEIPCELSPGLVSVTVNIRGIAKTISVPLQPASPGIFETPGSDRMRRAVALRPDGSFVTKENPAERGETVSVYMTGLGPVLPAIGTNQTAIPGIDSNVSYSVIVGVNDAAVQVLSATYLPDSIGVNIVSFTVPEDTPTGDVSLAVAVSLDGFLVFGNSSIIPIR